MDWKVAPYLSFVGEEWGNKFHTHSLESTGEDS